MIEELQRRNFAPGTIRAYVHGVEHFSQYFSTFIVVRIGFVRSISGSIRRCCSAS